MDAPRPTQRPDAGDTDLRLYLRTGEYRNLPKAREQFDALVARITDLETQVETWRSAYESANSNMVDLGEQWERKVTAAEAQVTHLAQYEAGMLIERERADAAEAQVAALTSELERVQRWFQTKPWVLAHPPHTTPMTLENAPTIIFAVLAGLLAFNTYLGARK